MNDETGKMADPHKAREYWTEVVRSASDRGRLEKVPTRLAKTKRERATAQSQNYWLSKKSFGVFGDNYDRIDWSRRA
jgi:hypothetical protein